MSKGGANFRVLYMHEFPTIALKHVLRVTIFLTPLLPLPPSPERNKQDARQAEHGIHARDEVVQRGVHLHDEDEVAQLEGAGEPRDAGEIFRPTQGR